MTLIVVKVGGSYAHFPRLRDLVAALEMGAGRAVIVPGGGPFADCVRREQGRMGFDDRAAHRMALLAMAAFGMALASFSRILAPAAGLEATRSALAAGRVPVWLPLAHIDGDAEIPENWDMTSDSLAAWLCGRLPAEQLVFLKRVSARSTRLADLVAAGILDPLVPKYLAGRPVEAFLCGPRSLSALGRALAEGKAAGRPIGVA